LHGLSHGAAAEAGKYSPTLEAAFLIAMALGKPLDEVFECVMVKK
jgi:putative transcriptional regulator